MLIGRITQAGAPSLSAVSGRNGHALLAVVALFLFTSGEAAAQDAVVVSVEGATSAEPALVDPTTVHGLFWWPPGYDRSWEYYDLTRPAESTPLPIGTTGDVGLSWTVVAPENGETWKVTYTAPSGFQYVYDNEYSYYAPWQQGCIYIRCSNTSSPIPTYCGGGCAWGPTSYLTFNLIEGLHYPCKPITTWDVEMTGSATFSGLINMVADGVGATAVTAPATMKPALPANVPTMYNNEPSIPEPSIGPDTDQLIVTAFDSLCPSVGVPNVPVQATLAFVSQSGGHTHATPPLPADQFNRILTVVPSGAAATFDAATGLFSGTTTSDGTIRALITGGAAGGDISISASSPSGGSPSSAAIALDPGLGLAPIAEEAGLFFLSGGTGQQCNNPTFCDRHANNHFLKPGVLPHAEQFAMRFRELNDGDVIVALDDMSLIRGGIFELDGEFVVGPNGHHLHRQGHDIDILWVRDTTTQQVECAKPCGSQNYGYEDDLSSAATLAGGRRVKEGPIHFRFPEN